jgi:hypothetical protein
MKMKRTPIFPLAAMAVLILLLATLGESTQGRRSWMSGLLVDQVAAETFQPVAHPALVAGPAAKLNFVISDFATGDMPECVAVADFNGDGISDLAVTGTGALSILIGNGDGTFQPPVTYDVPSDLPQGVATGDFNGDGKPDIVVALVNGNGASVFINNGDGTFQPQVFYPAIDATSVVVGDFNGDGKLDFVVGLDVYLGNGDGTFQTAMQFNVDIAYLEAADLNHDGKLDLVGTDGFMNMQVLLGNGDGTFQNVKSFPTKGYQPDGVALADFNGDGNIDAAVVNFCGSHHECEVDKGTTSILLGNGDGTFRSPKVYKTGGEPLSVASADFNGDGKPDVVVGAANVWFMLGNGDGTFQTPQEIEVPGEIGELATGQFDGNDQGSADVAGALGETNDVAVMLNAAATKLEFTSQPNPSKAGQVVTFRAKVAAAVNGQPTPTGIVKFYDGAIKLGKATLANGIATFKYSGLSVGKHFIAAIYSGDSNFNKNKSKSIVQVVDK